LDSHQTALFPSTLTLAVQPAINPVRPTQDRLLRHTSSREATAASRHTNRFLFGKPCSFLLAHSLRFSTRMSLTYDFFIPYFDPTHSDIISPSLFSSRSMWKLLCRCGRWDWYPIYQDCRYGRYPDGTLTYLRGIQSGFRIQSTNSTTHSFLYCSVICRIACLIVPCRIMSYAVL
jgi:hypothetical protein